MRPPLLPSGPPPRAAPTGAVVAAYGATPNERDLPSTLQIASSVRYSSIHWNYPERVVALCVTNGRQDSLAPSIDTVHQPVREHPEQRRRLADLFALLTTRMRSLRDPHEWSEIELTMPQFRALDLLVRGPQRMGDIASVLGTSLQATTSLIDRLTDKGLVERQHDTIDRRVVTCQITTTGRTEIERIYRLGQARTDLLVEVLTDDELGRVVDAFAILADAALRLQLGATLSASTATPRPMREHESQCPR